MTSRRRFRHIFQLSTLIACSVLIVTGIPAVAQSDAVQSPVGGRSLTLFGGEEGYVVVDGAGHRDAVPLPGDTVLGTLVETAGGWIAAGAAYEGDVTELVLVEKAGPTTRLVPGPEAAGDSFRSNPVPLVERGRLVGLAWLEGGGGERNAVRAARWTGEAWDDVATVSPPAFEAQLALSGTVLADGSWVLVWAAFQSGDDDIFWSRFDGYEWSAPAMLHGDNELPDIVPAVAAVGQGAVAAWSGYDGEDYRLRIYRLEAGEWLDTGFRGEVGSLYPAFVGAGKIPRMLYLTVQPRGWVVVELDDDGAISRRASAGRQDSYRPAVFDAPTGGDTPAGLRLRWSTRANEAFPAGPPATVERRAPWGERP